ncbi:HNH endonuclease [Leptospira perdikensis]|uniref:HNH endonuclease n=1 Tax=Leptospira perdikensis TaxID=2484948 RepID=A0A4R9JME9_9LEPT|nr:HNH endonuclease [Leptospira perdikensis]TGL45981.1 HNH endonuclease [Leptospira perdikensis]
MNTWLEDIKQALKNLNGIAEYKLIYEEVAKIRKDPLPESWQAIIRRTIETSSSDSDAFDKKKDLFFSVEGKGKGIWGLREYANKKIKLAVDINEPNENTTLRHNISVYRILRDTYLARELKLLYSDQCQICTVTLNLNDDQSYSEAHHVKPLGMPHNGPDSSDNLIIVCPNCHVKLDYGALELRNIPILKHSINSEYIYYHNNEIFGKL